MALPASLVQTLNSYHLQPYPSFTGLPRPITVVSISRFSGALIWGWLLLVSFTGWGRAAAKLLRTRPLPVSVACALGIATTIFIGGVLNLLHAIYAAVLFSLVGFGIILYLLFRDQKTEKCRWLTFWSGASKWSRLILVITLLILVFRVAATVRLGGFRIDDDGSAYLVFPQKMLATHYFAADPFSDRRVISSLGGSYFLQSLIIAATSLPHIGMADRTLGLVLMFLSLLDLGIAFGLSPPVLAIMELIVYLVPQETFNLTFTILPIPLVLAMVWLIFETTQEPEKRRWRDAALTGFIGGAIISLKSTYLPYVGALALFPYIFLFWKNQRKQSILLPIVAGLCALAVMVAWMVAMKYTSGTYLFPILGHGVDYASYVTFPSIPRFSSSRAFIKIFLQGAVLLLLASLQFYAGVRESKGRISFSVLIAAALAITAFNYESGGDFMWRYNFPQFFTAVIIFYVAQAAFYKGKYFRKEMRVYVIATLCLIGCIFYYDLSGGAFRPFRQMRMEMKQYPLNLSASLSGRRLVSSAYVAEYREVEAALPVGATAMDISIDSFLFGDKDHKTILINDWPGAAGPPPGWPLMQNSEAVAKYLLQNSVRYVIYDYRYGDWDSMKSCQFFPSIAHFSTADEKLEIANLVALHQLSELKNLHRSIYDDGKFAVIDLNSPVATNVPLENNWTIRTSVAQMCGVIAPKYIAAHPTGAVQPDQVTHQ